MPLSLYNSLKRRIETFVPARREQVTFYSCGPTVYDDAHIGNFRSFLAADVLRRWVESPLAGILAPGGRVLHVMNITDVGHMTDDDTADGAGEDKMAEGARRIAEAKKAGKLPAGVEVDGSDPYAVSGFYAQRFLEDARRLGLKVAQEAEADPSRMPRATAFVPAMVVVIGRLIERGHAYVAGVPGSRVVYFHVPSFASYGALSGNTLEALREGEGGRVSAENQAGKRHPADFLLWKEDPRHIMKWDSPWGPGYPGWHIECTAMSVWRAALDRADASPGAFADILRFGAPGAEPLIDLHSGGEDNAFPHHECEIAQSCCAFNGAPAGAPFARCWFHARHLMVEGQKMSKSKGNFYTPRQLFEMGHQPGALRLELIRAHYRSNANFTLQGLEDCARMVARWRRIVDAKPGAPSDVARLRGVAATQEFTHAMHADLNVSAAIAAVNTWAAGVAETPAPEDQATLRAFDGVLGVLELPQIQARATELAVYAPGTQPSDEVEALLQERRAARAAKDFGASDRLRDKLASMGYAIKDVAGGRVEVRRV